VSFLPKKTKFKQTCFQKKTCSMPHIQYTHKMKSIKWKTLKIFVTCECVTSEWHWNSTNIHLISVTPVYLSCIPHHHILEVLASKVLTKMGPDTVMGYTCIISEKESCSTSKKLAIRLCRLWIDTLTGNISHLNEKLNFNSLINKPARFLFCLS
jgi:hypothetical protein